MSIRVPDSTALDAAREAHEATGKQVDAARKAYEARVTRMVKGLTVADIVDHEDVAALASLAWSNRAAHDLIEEWVKSLGSAHVCASGVLYRRGEDGRHTGGVVAPSVAVWMPHDESAVEAAATAIERYREVVLPNLGTDALDIGITDNDLSASGSPRLTIHPDGSTEVRTITYGSDRPEWGPGSLREALAYLANHRWYGEPYPRTEGGW